MPEPRRNNTMIYVKLILSALLVAYVLFFMIYNSRNSATVWLYPFGGEHEMPTLLVIVITVILSTLGWWLGAQLYRTWKRRRAGR